MTKVEISKDGGETYGADLVDRWKARAFQQDPASEVPCCGYEEEDNNWGGSSTLLGEKVGPVRAIRETWGADSGTNVVRRETFYREEMRQLTFLRVHPIPPLDGIYAQWDFNAGRMTKYYNPRNPDGVAVDGKNDEVVGNLDDPCNERFDGNDTGDVDQAYRSAYRQAGLCHEAIQEQNHSSVDPGDPTFNDPNVGTGWNVTAGPWGSIVDRFSIQPDKTTAGGLAQSLVAVPYYRDDACFDDGTGSDPGPELFPRQPQKEAATRAPDGSPRRCWRGDPAVPDGDQRFWQGSIATHGLHLLFVVDSDNAACSEGGTGSDPGRGLSPPRPKKEAARGAPDASPRRCWRGDPAVPDGDQRFWQGSIATHGLHLLFVVDSDNARQTVPTNEI